MKTSVSIPDRVFRHADRAARKLRISRSELYARAIQAYLDGLNDQRITEALNRVYSAAPSTLDAGLARMQSASLPRERW